MMMEVKIGDIGAITALIIISVLFFYEKISNEFFIMIFLAILLYFGIKTTVSFGVQHLRLKE